MALQNSYNNTWYPGVKAGGTFAVGDILYVAASGNFERLAAGTVGQSLAISDVGGGVLLPTWQAGLSPGGNAGGDLTGTYPNPTIAARAVTFARLQAINTATFLGRTAAGAGDVQALTAAQFRTGLELGTAALVDTGTGSGQIPLLDGNGYFPATVIPPLRSHEFLKVADEAARLALTTSQVQPGDTVTQLDSGETFKLFDPDPSLTASWVRLSSSQIDASEVISGIFSPDRLGSGTADSTTVLHGDQVYRAIVPRLPAVQTLANTTLTANTSHHIQSENSLSLALPAVSALGDVIRIVGVASGDPHAITQSAGQYVRFGDKITTVGAAGQVIFATPVDSITLECIEANLGWAVTAAIGNFELI